MLEEEPSPGSPAAQGERTAWVPGPLLIRVLKTPLRGLRKGPRHRPGAPRLLPVPLRGLKGKGAAGHSSQSKATRVPRATLSTSRPKTTRRGQEGSGEREPKGKGREGGGGGDEEEHEDSEDFDSISSGSSEPMPGLMSGSSSSGSSSSSGDSELMPDLTDNSSPGSSSDEMPELMSATSSSGLGGGWIRGGSEAAVEGEEEARWRRPGLRGGGRGGAEPWALSRLD